MIDLNSWVCHRCKAPPMELVASASPDLMTGRCSNYSCPTRAPRKVKLKVGGYANLPGQSTFTRKRI